MCTDVLMNDYVGRGKETFTYMYKECKHYISSLNPIPTRGGGAHCAPPPPQVHFLKYLRNALSYGLETF